MKEEVGMQNGTAQHYENLNKEISNHHIDGTPGQGALDVWKMGGGAIGIWGGSSYFDSFKTIYNRNTTDGHGGAINIGRVNFSDGNYFYTSASASVSKAEFTNNSGSRGGAVIIIPLRIFYQNLISLKGMLPRVAAQFLTGLFLITLMKLH